MRIEQLVESHADMKVVLENLLGDVGLRCSDTGGDISFAGLEPLRPTVLKVGAASAIIAAAGACASAILWRMRGGVEQDIHVDLRKAFAYQSPWQDVLADCTQIFGTSEMNYPTYGDLLLLLPCKDDRHVMYCAPYPSQQVTAARLFRCGNVEEQLSAVTKTWDAGELERIAQERELPITMVRTQQEFRDSEQWDAHANEPLIKIEKIGDAATEPLPTSARPLSGVRVLGMTHVVAGPVVLRQMAASGADCLNLNMPGWVEVRKFYLQSDVGMRQAILDARAPENRQAVYDLVKGADVFVENLKPNEAVREGYSPQELAEVRPGIVYVRIKLNPVDSPWGHWLGFDVNAGAFTGVYADEGTLRRPLLPQGVNVVVDFLCGMLATVGAIAALIRRAEEGGSYLVTVTLAQATQFELSLGLNSKVLLDQIPDLGPQHQITKPNLVSSMTPFGLFTRIGSQVEQTRTPEFWEEPILVPRGSSRPEWRPRSQT